ncbi:MAG TPA: serine/threonine-protein kinase [Solirubrobacteraceae bacterium]|nr:serine/threonine-protein kinase [Solirubrobacteraceae bacterium]
MSDERKPPEEDQPTRIARHGDTAAETTRIARVGSTADETTRIAARAPLEQAERTPTGPEREHLQVARAELVAGDVFADRRIDRELGRGAMGIVYRVTHLKLGRPEALKIIAPKLAGDPAYRKRFEREATHTAIAANSHVVTVYDAGERDGLLYICMEYVDGMDLRSLLASQSPLHPSLAARITQQLAAALDAAHSHGLIHRDVKPANVFVSGAPGAEHVRLGDFGVSRALAASDLTEAGSSVGTPHYTAPEVHLGREADHRSDIYSLGCTLYEMLTGRKPFPAQTSTAVAMAHCQQPPPSPLDTVPSLPAALEAVVAKALAKNPDERYQTAGDLGEAVAEAVRAGDQPQERVERVPPPPPEHSAPPPPPPVTGPPEIPDQGDRRARGLAIAAAATVAVAAIVAVVILLGSGSSSPSQPAKRASPSTWPVYRSSAFSASHPPGWQVSALVQDGYTETRFTDPNSGAIVLIDRTPGDPDTPEQAAISVQASAATEAGYSEVAFDATTLAGQPAWRWVLYLPESSSLPGGERVDFFRHIAGDRYATLGLGGNFAHTEQVARQVAASIRAGQQG